MESRLGGRVLQRLSADGEFSVEHAYAIQDALRAELIRQGQRPIGWKLAATGPAGQEMLGIKELLYGFLLPERYDSGDEVPAAAFVDLHAEAEIAFKLGAALPGPGVTAATALEAWRSAKRACSERPKREPQESAHADVQAANKDLATQGPSHQVWPKSSFLHR
jgi:hypothetical protein